MSDAWQRCSDLLRVYLGDETWSRVIAPQRSWVDAGVLYLWLDRDSGDHRALVNPAQKFDAAIREAMIKVFGRAPRDIRYLDRPPRREHIINTRRSTQHRERSVRQQDREHAELMALAIEECKRLLDDPGQLRSTGSAAEQRLQLARLVMDRAKRRRAQRSLRPDAGRSPVAPEDVPPWPR